MFGLISKKRLLNFLVDFYVEHSDPEPHGRTSEERMNNLYYETGNCNAINFIATHGVGVSENAFAKMTADAFNKRYKRHIKVEDKQ